MDWIWKNLFTNLVFEVFLVLGGAAAFAYAKRKIPEHAATIAYGALGAICASILIFTFTGRAIFSSRPPAPVTQDNIEENVKVWAEHLGMNIGPVDEPNSYFAHMLSLPNSGQQVEVFRSVKEKPGYLQFKALINVAAEHQQAFSKMPQALVDRISERLSLNLGQANLGCSVAEVMTVNEQEHKTIIAGIFLQRGVAIANMNETVFSDTYDQLTRGMTIVKSFIRLAATAPESIANPVR